VKQKDVFTTGDVASICKCSHDTVKRWLESQQLRGYRLTPQGQWRVLPDDLVRFIEQQGFPIDEKARSVLGLPEPAIKDYVYCWEFHRRNKTTPVIEGKTCEDCLVFNTRAKQCYVLKEHESHDKVFCQGSCNECDYYRYVTEKDMPRKSSEV
jgi:hypothetical protein